MEDKLEKLGYDLLVEIGEDPTREGLKETPKRFAKMIREVTHGYKKNPLELAKMFVESNPSKIIRVEDIDYYSLCEHHMLPFWGTVDIEYKPKDKVMGLSKLARLSHALASRLQVQERLTQEICDIVVQATKTDYCKVTVKGQHFCMIMRGVKSASSKTVTISEYGEKTT